MRMAASAALCQAMRRQGCLHTLLSNERSMDVVEAVAIIVQPFDRS